MRRLLLFVLCIFPSVAVQAQSSTTDCYGYGSSVHCNTQTRPGVDWNAWQQQQQQTQQNMNEAFSNLGRAIAARRERKREEKAEAAQAAAQAATAAAIKAALAADNATEQPAPSDEQPVLLACTINGSPGSIALYEKHGRVDTTTGGTTRTRQAVFSTEAVTWTTPLLRSSLSRVDGTYVGRGNIPEVEGQSITGTCVVAAQRKF